MTLPRIADLLATGSNLYHVYPRDYPPQVCTLFIPSQHSDLRSTHVAVLERDAEMVIRGLRNRQLHHSPSPPPESVVSDEAPSEPTPITPTTPRSPIFSNVFSKLLGRPTAAPVGSKLWQGSEPQVCIFVKQNNPQGLILVAMGGF